MSNSTSLDDTIAGANKPSVSMVAEIVTNLFLFLLIFGMSGTVDMRNLRRQMRNRYAIMTGVAMQFIVMPLLGFIAVVSLKNTGLTPPMGITLLIVTSSPGGSYSNWWCSLFNADLALSVAMTALSTVLSIGLLPANLLIYAHAAYGFDADEDHNVLKSVDFVKLFISLSIVISAIVFGLYASYYTENNQFRKFANALGSISGVLLIAVSAFFSTAGETDAKPWNQHWSFFIGVGMPCVGGLALANVLAKCARLEKPEIVTLSVECSYQNVGIATSAALAMFSDPDDIAQAMAVPLFYGVVEMVVLATYCVIAWKLGWTKAPKEEKICKVISKTYEVEDDDDDDLTALQDSLPPSDDDIKRAEEGDMIVKPCDSNGDNTLEALSSEELDLTKMSPDDESNEDTPSLSPVRINRLESSQPSALVNRDWGSLQSNR
jgi:predicted Na+-dependent transporter